VALPDPAEILREPALSPLAAAPAEAADPDVPRTQIVVVGHVDHGKSTVIGRLLADTDSLPAGKLDRVRALCERTSKPFEYAFLLDALKDEQAQGITIDSARVFFRTARRPYAIIDAPGHIEFLKNMITGAARADGALLVIDAQEGLRENSRRHATMLSMLGIREIAVLINKMDLVGFAHDRFDTLAGEMRAFLKQLGLDPIAFVAMSGRGGDNLVERSAAMPWYAGPTVVEALDAFTARESPASAAFRMPVQDIYKFTKFGDDRRIVAGSVVSGTLHAGDEVVFYPSGKRKRVRTLEGFNRPGFDSVTAGDSAGFTLDEQIYVTRGEIAARVDEPKPLVSRRLRVSLFWLGKAPLRQDREYLFKLGTARAPMRVERIERVLDASSLEAQGGRQEIERHEVADCVLQLQRAVAFDLAADIPATGRFVIVSEYEISGGGVVREMLQDDEEWVRDRAQVRNAAWESSLVTSERRTERYSQRAALVVVTGDRRTDRKRLAKAFEARLFADGRLAYFLGMGNLLHGVDADVDNAPAHRLEHFRRLGEIAHLMLDAGLILVVSAAELADDELQVLRTLLRPERVLVAWLGNGVPGFACDLVIRDAGRDDAGSDALKTLLQDRGIIFRS
jgi:bifunctional enzyme CysN/CysC